MLTKTLKSLERVVKSSENVILMGDFNCKVCWEEWCTDGGEETLGAKILNLAMENTMTQWIGKETRYQCNEEPSRFDLVLTREVDMVRKLSVTKGGKGGEIRRERERDIRTGRGKEEV